MTAFFLSLALIFAAEFGDKTQLVALAFATRYKPSIVLGGIALAALAAHLVSVAIGQAAGNLIPRTFLNWAVGLTFITFGVLTMRGGAVDDEHDPREHKFGPFISVAMTFFLAELGDKTMIATMALASQLHDFVGVWLGSSVGMVLAGAVAILIGNVLGKRVPTPIVNGVAAVIFIATGIFTLARAAFAQ